MSVSVFFYFLEKVKKKSQDLAEVLLFLMYQNGPTFIFFYTILICETK
jgi:hypothetical protein